MRFTRFTEDLLKNTKMEIEMLKIIKYVDFENVNVFVIFMLNIKVNIRFW